MSKSGIAGDLGRLCIILFSVLGGAAYARSEWCFLLLGCFAYACLFLGLILLLKGGTTAIVPVLPNDRADRACSRAARWD